MAQDILNICEYKLRAGGTGSVRVQPDLTSVSLGVITENNQLTLAQDENAVIMSQVLKVLNESGISQDDIKTQVYNISPQYDYIEGRQVFRGYRVEHILNVNVRKINDIGKVIDNAVRSGANQVGNVSFLISNPNVYYQQALNKAVEDAAAKAVALGRKFNVEVSRVPIRITEIESQAQMQGSPLMMRDMSTPIQAGINEITARIEAIFTYKPK